MFEQDLGFDRSDSPQLFLCSRPLRSFNPFRYPVRVRARPARDSRAVNGCFAINLSGGGMHRGSSKPITSIVEIALGSVDNPLNIGAVRVRGLLYQYMRSLQVAGRQQQ